MDPPPPDDSAPHQTGGGGLGDRSHDLVKCVHCTAMLPRRNKSIRDQHYTREHQDKVTVTFSTGKQGVVPREKDSTFRCPCGVTKSSIPTLRYHARTCSGQPMDAHPKPTTDDDGTSSMEVSLGGESLVSYTRVLGCRATTTNASGVASPVTILYASPPAAPTNTNPMKPSRIHHRISSCCGGR